MLDLPSWLGKKFGELKCPHCNTALKKDNITGQGIMKSENFKNRTVYFIIYDCPDCSKRAIIPLNRMTLEEFVQEMTEEYSDKNKEESSEEPEKEKSVKKQEEKKEVKKTGISQEETDAFLKKLNEVKYHEDFMKYIGISQEDIDNLNKEEEGESA